MSSEGRLGLFHVPPERPFAEALAAGIIARFPDPLARARIRLLIPSRRAARTLTDAFLAASDGQAMLLPRIAAIGDVDEGEALGLFTDAADELALPPAIAPLDRTLAMARLLEPMAGSVTQAMALAQSMGRLMDRLTIQGVPLAALGTLDLGDMARHQQRNRAILDAIARAWPDLLADRGLMDATARREALLQRLAGRWAAGPPPYPLVAAGFASAPPAVAGLLGVVARLPAGAVVLPGLDPGMDKALTDAVRAAPTHPHHGMLLLLEAIGATPAELQPWDAPAAGMDAAARAAQLAVAFMPAALAADRWQVAPADPPAGVARMEVASAEEEALLAALALRRTLETPGATAMVVTPSRPLARRIAAELARFGIAISDSAGEPLAGRPPGSLLLALADAAAQQFAPVALLALLKHPLAGATTPERRADWREGARLADAALRGIAPAPGLGAILDRVHRRPRFAEAATWLEAEVLPALAPLEALFGSPVDLAHMVERLAAAGTALAGDTLWAGIDGRALAGLVEALAASTDAARLMVPPAAAVPLLQRLLADIAVRPPWRQHPRVQILGPLEARMQSADMVVLAGLTDGQWPTVPAIDPWLPPAALRALGLPPDSARVGLQAHDVLAAMAAAPRLLLTHARREGGSAANPSPFLMRLAAALGPLPEDCELRAALALDGGHLPHRLARPAPAPPVAARPKALAVTDADTLAADPFAFFAKRILVLREWDPLEQEPDAAVRGTAVHRLLEEWQAPSADDDARVDAVLGALGGSAALALMWRPRLLRTLAWVRAELAAEAAAPPHWTPAGVETALEAHRHGIRLHGKADRIDRDAQGRYRIVDYKTGSVPAKKRFEEGQARQLPLLRLLLESGGTPQLPAGEVAELAYWKLGGGTPAGEIKGRGWQLDPTAFEAALHAALHHWLLGEAAFVPRLLPLHAAGYRGYDHLARTDEWLGRDESEPAR